MSETSIRSIRPQTKRLDRPTPNITHPVIEISPVRSPRQSPEAFKTASKTFSGFHADVAHDIKMKSSEPKKLPQRPPFVLQSVPKPSLDHANRRTNSLHTHNTDGDGKTKVTKAKQESNPSVPAPCTACDRDVAPERLHSHTPPGWRSVKSNSDNNGTTTTTTTASTTTTTEKPVVHATKKLIVRNRHSARHTNMSKLLNQDSKSSSARHVASKTNNNNQIGNGTSPGDRGTANDKASDSAGEKSEPVKGPPMLMCYICGRPFGSKSLPLHEPKCLEKWKWENSLLPKDQQRPVPQKPENYENMSRNEYNEASWQIFNSQLLPCSKCGRTFFANRLPVHERACKAQVKSAPSGPAAVNITNINPSLSTSAEFEGTGLTTYKRPLRAPMSIPCYICGRMFGTMSISVHEPQCLKKWRTENEQLPSHLQRPEPVKPVIELKEDGTIDVDAVAEASWESHLQQLVPCSRCGRTFFPDRLPVHERSCKVDPSEQIAKAMTSKEEVHSAAQ